MSPSPLMVQSIYTSMIVALAEASSCWAEAAAATIWFVSPLTPVVVLIAASSLGFLKYQSEVMIEFGQASAFSRRLRSSSQMHRRNDFLFLVDSSSSPRRRRGFTSKQLKNPITTAIQEATCNMQVASLQSATSKLQQNISQLPEKRQRERNWALSPICQSNRCKQHQPLWWIIIIIIIIII